MEKQSILQPKQLIEEPEKEKEQYGCYLCTLQCCGCCCGLMSAWIPCCCCIANPYQRVQESFFGVIERFGKFQRYVKPGLHYINPCTEKLKQVEAKTQIIDLDAVRYLTFSTLRNVIGEHSLQELLEKRVEITKFILQYVDENTDEWGIKITDVFIKDIVLSNDVATVLSSAIKSKKFAESKIISAKADVQAAHLMKTSAEILNTKSAMQIRYLDTIHQLSRRGFPKLIFIPFDEKASYDK